jgi:hypothetical protein
MKIGLFTGKKNGQQQLIADARPLISPPPDKNKIDQPEPFSSLLKCFDPFSLEELVAQFWGLKGGEELKKNDGCVISVYSKITRRGLIFLNSKFLVEQYFSGNFFRFLPPPPHMK